MAKEIERKFLVRNQDWKKEGITGRLYRQGYLPVAKGATVRLRLIEGKKKGYLTIKGPRNGLTRSEFEYKVPVTDAEQMFAELCVHTIEKTRHKIRRGIHIWELDVFHGENEGLVTAEIELSSEDEKFTKPSWVGWEVTDISRYSSASLARSPFSKWRNHS